jgi:hypothetical protein
MFSRRNWIAVIVLILGLIVFIPTAQAQRQEFEAMQCGVATVNYIHASPELAITSWDLNGIIQSTDPSKLFNNWTRHLVMVYKRIDRTMSWNGFSKTIYGTGWGIYHLGVFWRQSTRWYNLQGRPRYGKMEGRKRRV